MERSIPELIRDIANDVQEIVRSELRLARAEITEQFATLKKVAGSAIPAAVLGFYAVGFLLLACMFALEIAIPAWASALIVAVIAGIVARGLLTGAMFKAKQLRPPERTVGTVKENVQWARDQMK